MITENSNVLCSKNVSHINTYILCFKICFAPIWKIIYISRKSRKRKKLGSVHRKKKTEKFGSSMSFELSKTKYNNYLNLLKY